MDPALTFAALDTLQAVSDLGYTVVGNAALWVLTGYCGDRCTDMVAVGDVRSAGVQRLLHGWTRQNDPFTLSGVTFAHDAHPFTVTIMHSRRPPKATTKRVMGRTVTVAHADTLRRQYAYHNDRVAVEALDLHPDITHARAAAAPVPLFV